MQKNVKMTSYKDKLLYCYIYSFNLDLKCIAYDENKHGLTLKRCNFTINACDVYTVFHTVTESHWKDTIEELQKPQKHV